MLPVLNPISKTSIELRRAINRLHLFIEQNQGDPLVNVATELIEDLKAARRHIPKDLVDLDLKENKDDKDDKDGI